MTIETDKSFKAPKLYRNGKTYAENIANGTFQPIGALKFQNEMKAEMNDLKNMLSNIVEQLANKQIVRTTPTSMWGIAHRKNLL